MNLIRNQSKAGHPDPGHLYTLALLAYKKIYNTLLAIVLLSISNLNVPAPIDDGHALATENIPGAHLPWEAGARHHRAIRGEALNLLGVALKHHRHWLQHHLRTGVSIDCVTIRPARSPLSVISCAHTPKHS